jgi:hypothetical protein
LGTLASVVTSNIQLDQDTSSNVVPPKIHNANHTAIADTGATGHYLDAAAEPHCINIEPTTEGPSVQVANGQNIETTKRATVPLAKELSSKAKEGHIFDGLKSGSLLSIGQLCDDDCVALFTKYDVKIYKQGQIIIVGERDPNNGLWTLPIAPKPTIHRANGAIHDSATKADLAMFLHAALYSPVPSTVLRAIERAHFESWPGLTTSLVTKHLAKSLATSKGHLRTQQKNIQSTKNTQQNNIPSTKNTQPNNMQSTKITSDLDMQTSLDYSPSQEPQNKRTHSVFITLMKATDLRKSYSDQTGKFPVQSSRGHNYVMVLYEYDSNAILSTPLKSRVAGELTKAWTELYNKLQVNGYAPEIHILDNECSAELKKAFKKYNVDFQLVPPHIHRANAAERAIQTWKNHFCAGLATCNPKFP